VAAGGHREEGPARSRRIVVVLARFLVAALVLAYLVTRIDLASVWASMRDTPPAAVAEAFVTWMVGWWIVSYRLGLLMQAQGVRMGTFEALEINLATLFYGLFLPGGNLTGIAVRLYRLSRASGDYAAGILAMASDRVAATAAISAVGLSCVMLDPHDTPTAALAVLLVSGGGVVATMAPFAASEQLRRVARALRTRSLEWIWAGLRRTGAAFDAIAHLPGRTIVLLLFLSCLAQLPGIVAFEILARALGLPLSFATLGWVRSVTLIVTALPISIAGLGVREGVLLLLLRPYGVADHDALAFSLLVFAVTIVGAGLLGGVLEVFRWLVPRAPT
jgi:uncharacterized membrane protein YbhN (UPF0104 family)